MPRYNLTEYSSNYSNASKRIYTLTDAATIKNLPGDSALFKCKVKITEKSMLVVIQKMLK